MIKKWWKTIAAYLACVLAGLVLGWFIHGPTPLLYKGGLLYQRNAPYKYVDPLLACDIGSQDAFPEFASLKSQINSYIQTQVKAGDTQHISVYVRSLRSARWLEINPTDTYAPASLLKVFIMMAYYKEADDSDNPELLDKKIIFEANSTSSQEEPGEAIPHLTAGSAYTVDQVINQMIIYSDNDALYTLVDNFDPQTLTAFQAIFADLNIPSPVTQTEGSLNYMTVDNYAMVFRVLYGSTYLSTRYSEQALTLLGQAHYKGGIVSGIPNTLTVAHKFGVTTIPATATSTASNELHDCGIIYYPNNHPYLLCVMTEGKTFTQLQKNLSDISGITYAWLNNYYSNLPSATTTTPSIVRP